MFFIYVLRSINRNYIYVGLTSNVTKRFNQHQQGKNQTTKPYLPFILVLQEQYNTRMEARQREKYLKSGVGKEFLKRLN